MAILISCINSVRLKPSVQMANSSNTLDDECALREKYMHMHIIHEKWKTSHAQAFSPHIYIYLFVRSEDS